MRNRLLGVTLAALIVVGPAEAQSLPDVCGNVNGSDNGDVTTGDALLVLKRAVGQDVGMICGPPGLPVRTGDVTSYGSTSDGSRGDGAVRSFTDNGDGTVTDWGTGLMWETKDRSGGIHDASNQYTWSESGNQMNGTIVSSFLASLNDGGGFAGHADWRIPNRFELETLLNLSNLNPSTHFKFNRSCTPSCTMPTCSCTTPSFYWSSTSTTEADAAWVVSFSDGVVLGAIKTITGFARAVRSVGELTTASVCLAPNPPQCLFNDPCTDGVCSVTREICVQQSDCPLSPDEQCCCSGACE